MRRPTLPANGRFFDDRPLKIGGFELRARAAVPMVGPRPDASGWQVAFQYATASEEGSPYWVGDLIEYLDSREDWRAQREQLLSVTGLAHHTLENRATVSRKVKGRARDLSPSITHAAAVTKLEAPEQERWLDKAQTEGWTVREFTRELKAAEQTRVTEGQAPTLHTVDVTVRVVEEAEGGSAAERQAWARVKAAVATLAHAHVIAARASSHIGARPAAQKDLGRHRGVA